MYSKLIKPLLDITFAIIGIIILSPVAIVISLYCCINFNGRVLFKQQRIGRNEKPFIIYKFITMHPAKGKFQHKSDTERLTKAGALLRITSLDELPQLLNIATGSMSWIGPRPLLPEYLPFYTHEEKKRHEVKPGITGLAQINGRNVIGWDERLRLDVQYVQELNFMLDCKIAFKTIRYILRRESVVADPKSVLQPLNKERQEIPQIK